VRESGDVLPKAAGAATEVHAPAHVRRALWLFDVAVQVGCKTASSACGPLTFGCRLRPTFLRWPSRPVAARDHGNTRKTARTSASATRGTGILCPRRAIPAPHSRGRSGGRTTTRRRGSADQDGRRGERVPRGTTQGRAHRRSTWTPRHPRDRPTAPRHRRGRQDRVSTSNIGLIGRSPQWLIAQSNGDNALTAFAARRPARPPGPARGSGPRRPALRPRPERLFHGSLRVYHSKLTSDSL
jgi:hypothetical protein